MAGKRIHANELVRLFSAAPQPIYALDEDLTIIFLNPACKQWLGAASEGVVGMRTAYHSAPDAESPEGMAAGLCPPPEAIAGKISSAVVSCVSALSTNLRSVPGEGQGMRAGTLENRRRATFFPLGSPDDVRGILAILEVEDFSPAPAEDEEATANEPGREQLHAVIRRFRREVAGRCSADHLVGTSPAMQLARRQVEAAAASGCGVCIAGPPGSGRERLAAAIHYARNPRDAKIPFAEGGLITLDCSVLPAEYIHTTLAALSRPRSANADADIVAPASLVLDHVDELPAELQAELAALFSKRLFPRRLISTSAVPLGELVQRGKFNAELASLLSAITIVLPPLGDRREDLPLLAQIFLEDCNRRGSKQVGGFAPESLDKLDAYAWPGNLDELVAIVSAAHKNAQGTEVTPEELPPQIHLAAQATAHPRRVEETIHLDEFLGRVERELIRRAIARAKGNRAKAARLLGLNRPRLLRRMKQLGLEEA
jgi:DNA-binding NtrC family response regulator